MSLAANLQPSLQTRNASSFLWSVLIPQLVPDLLPQLLDGNLRLEHLADPRPPVLLEGLHLALDLVLPRGARGIHEVHLALRRRELGLDGPEVGLDGVVAEQPGVLARAVEELQVLVARGEVRRGHVGALERRAEGGGVGGIGGRLLRLVAGEVERLEGHLGGDAFKLGGHGRREGWLAGGGGGKEGGRLGGGGGGELGGDEGARGGEGLGGGFGVNVYPGEVSSCWAGGDGGREGDAQGRDS